MSSLSRRPRRACRDAAHPIVDRSSDDETDASDDDDGDDRNADSDFDGDDSSSDEDDVEDDDDEIECFSGDDDGGDDDDASVSDSDDPHDEARRVRARLMRELCEEHKDYAAFTTEETRWALRVISRVDLSAYTTASTRAFVGRAMTPETHDVDAAVACVGKIVVRMRRDRLYASIFETFGGERGGVPLAFRRVDAIQLLFACLLVTKERDLFLVATPEERRAIDDALPPDVVREHVAPRVARVSVDDARVEVIAEETWGEVRGRLLTIRDAGESDRVVRRHVGGAVAALVFARRADFDFDAVGWTPRRTGDIVSRGSSIPTHGASRSARPAFDKRRVRVEVLDARGRVDRVVYAHVPRDGFDVQNTLDYAKTTYEDVALLPGLTRTLLVLVWDLRHPPSWRDTPIVARGEVRKNCGSRLALRAIPRSYFAENDVVPYDFTSVRANAMRDVDATIRAAVGDDPRAGASDAVELEYGGLGWKTNGTVRCNPNADPRKPRVVASRENKIRRVVEVARRRFVKRLDVVARRAAPPTAAVVELFAKDPTFYARREEREE